MAVDGKSLCCPIKFLGGGGNSKMVPLRLVGRRELPGCPQPPLKAISTPIVNLEKPKKGKSGKSKSEMDAVDNGRKNKGGKFRKPPPHLRVMGQHAQWVKCPPPKPS